MMLHGMLMAFLLGFKVAAAAGAFGLGALFAVWPAIALINWLFWGRKKKK